MIKRSGDGICSSRTQGDRNTKFFRASWDLQETARSDDLSTADRRSNAEISSSFKPKVIWLARVNARRIKVMLSIGGERQKRMVNIGGVRIPFNIRPTVVPH